MSQSDQSAVEGFLAKAVGPNGRMIETHISKVYLGDTRAYKLKKAVTFPYLDYGSIDLRHQACEDEFRLNRVFAPELYLGVSSITQSEDGSLEFDGSGKPCDWVVVMARFPDDYRLDRVLAQGRLTRRHIVQLADLIRTAHKSAPIRSDRGGAKGLQYVADSNRDWLRGLANDAIDHDRVEAILEAQRVELFNWKDALEARRKSGAVRQCHSDMHMENLVLWNDRPIPFDAIEFNDWIGCVDRLYDLAFPIMDLIRRGHPTFASVLWNRYLDHSGFEDGAELTALFMSFRAMVRALVEGTSGHEAHTHPYLELAERSLKNHKAGLVAIGGLSGSGKSRMGRELSPYLGRVPGARQVRTDVVRKRIWGQGFDVKLPAEGYSAAMNEKTYTAFYQECRDVLNVGYWVVADGVFARVEERNKIQSLAEELGVSFFGLWLDAPLDVREGRVVERTHDVSDATPEVLAMQMDYDLGDIEWPTVDTAQSKERSLADALGIITRPLH